MLKDRVLLALQQHKAPNKMSTVEKVSNWIGGGASLESIEKVLDELFHEGLASCAGFNDGTTRWMANSK